MITKLAIIIAAALLLFYTLGGRRTHAVRAYKKIGLTILVFTMIVAAIFPNLTNDVAHAVGVGRGADLLLYGLTLAFITYTLNSYVRQQDDRDELHRLARKVALMEALTRYKIDRK